MCVTWQLEGDLFRLRDAVARLYDWAKECANLFTPDAMEKGDNIWLGAEVLALFEAKGVVSSSTYPLLAEAVNEVCLAVCVRVSPVASVCVCVCVCVCQAKKQRVEAALADPKVPTAVVWPFAHWMMLPLCVCAWVQLSGPTMFVLEKLMVVWKFMLMNNRVFCESYRVAITKERVVGPLGVAYVNMVCFWCMNPQVRATGGG